MDVSVVIPVRDGERYLAEAITSALAQEPKPREVLVVDDGSQDRSAEIARSFGAPVRVLASPPLGRGAARNRGVTAARGELVAFLDSDDLWPAEALARRTAQLAHEPELDASFGLVTQFLSPDLGQEERGRLRCPEGSERALLPGAMLVRRRALERFGAFSETLRVGEFVDWYDRAAGAGLQAVFGSEVGLLRRIHAGHLGRSLGEERVDYARVAWEALQRRRRP